MFPIIPSYLSSSRNSSESITSFVTGSSKLLVPGKVTAATNILQGALSAAIHPEKLLGQPDVVQISALGTCVGIIDLDDKSKELWCNIDTHWVRALRLSDDCHSYNIQLRFQPSQRPGASLNKNQPTPKLVLQAVRPIETGQELLLWFSEDILAMLQIGFLTPAHIQGQKKYVCTRCSALYESPNPLKLHIALACGRFSITSLWEKLSNILRENTLHNILQRNIFDFKLSPEPQQTTKQRNAIDLSISTLSQLTKQQETCAKHNSDIYRPYSVETRSAFKPFKKCDNTDNSAIQSSSVWPMVPLQFQQFNDNDNKIGYGDEAHIETLVSSLGKSKQGHYCLYCGKCYSRKYGLKIHIRTHTGYKPLKCKFCMRPFGDPSNLNKHVRLHAEGNTPYKCDLCGKILVRRRDLDRHLKSRHMIEMHPDLNLLVQDNASQIEVKKEDEQIK